MRVLHLHRPRVHCTEERYTAAHPDTVSADGGHSDGHSSVRIPAPEDVPADGSDSDHIPEERGSEDAGLRSAEVSAVSWSRLRYSKPVPVQEHRQDGSDIPDCPQDADSAQVSGGYTGCRVRIRQVLRRNPFCEDCS